MLIKHGMVVFGVVWVSRKEEASNREQYIVEYMRDSVRFACIAMMLSSFGCLSVVVCEAAWMRCLLDTHVVLCGDGIQWNHELGYFIINIYEIGFSSVYSVSPPPSSLRCSRAHIVSTIAQCFAIADSGQIKYASPLTGRLVGRSPASAYCSERVRLCPTQPVV